MRFYHRLDVHYILCIIFIQTHSLAALAIIELSKRYITGTLTLQTSDKQLNARCRNEEVFQYTALVSVESVCRIDVSVLFITISLV